MESAFIGLLGVVIGAAIGWLAGLAAAERGAQRARELWERERRESDDQLRRTLGEELRANVLLLKSAREKGHHGLTQRGAWGVATGLSFREQRSREFLQRAYVAAAQYDTAVRQIPPMGSGNPRAEATNLALELAGEALEAFEEAARLYVANGEDPAHPPRKVPPAQVRSR